MVERSELRGEAALQAEITRLNKVVNALMDRAERESGVNRNNFGLFRESVMLQEVVGRRTAELEAALRENERINRDLLSEREAQQRLIQRLEEAHNQLLQSEKLASVGQLAAGVAHEINNPVAFVGANLGALQKYVDGMLSLIDAYAAVSDQLSPEAQEGIAALAGRIDFEYLRRDVAGLIEESIEGTRRVRKIVQDLRSFSQEGAVRWQRVDVVACIDSALNMLAHELAGRIEVIRDLTSPAEIDGVPAELNQLFLNLLLNAIQSVHGEGRLTIRCRPDEAAVTVEIIDTGEGIAPEIRGKVFDPFFTTRPVGRGTGLGLSVAHGIVAAHGGRIKALENPEGGSIFVVHLARRRESVSLDSNACL